MYRKPLTMGDFALITRTARARASYPSCVAVYPRDSQSLRVLCRCSHQLHSNSFAAPLTRSYPRRFTFYVADPISSIPDLWQQEAVRALQQGKDVVVQAHDSFKIGGHRALLYRVCIAEESIQIQGPCIHYDRTIGIVRPFVFRAIPVKLQPVLIGIAEVKCFTHPVITRAFEWNLGCKQPAERVAEPRSIGIKNSNVKQTRAAGRRWRTAETFPRVQSDVMMISPSRNKRCFCPPALHQLKPEHAAVKFERAFQIRNF
jgi:hypothetical protein